MPRIQFFMHPKALFELVEAEARRDPRIRVIFQRYQPEKRDPPPEIRVMEPGEDLAQIYCAEGYSSIYLTLGALPRGSEDLLFTNNDAVRVELLMLEGGRLKGNRLEMADLCTGLKKSPVEWLYKRLQRAIAKRCKRGIVSTGGVEYPDYCDPAVAGLDLVGSVDEEGGHYRPLHAEQHRRAS